MNYICILEELFLFIYIKEISKIFFEIVLRQRMMFVGYKVWVKNYEIVYCKKWCICKVYF